MREEHKRDVGLDQCDTAVSSWHRVRRIDVRHTATEALTVLKHQARVERDHLPELIVLDLDLPGGAGLAFLRELQGDAELKRLPVIVMAWSEEEAAVRSLSALGVTAYVIKPLFFADLLTLVGPLSSSYMARRSASALLPCVTTAPPLQGKGLSN